MSLRTGGMLLGAGLVGCRAASPEDAALLVAVADYHLQILDESRMLDTAALTISPGAGILGETTLEIESGTDSDLIWLDIAATYQQAGLAESDGLRWDGAGTWLLERGTDGDATYTHDLDSTLILAAAPDEIRHLSAQIQAEDAGLVRTWRVTGAVDGAESEALVVREERLDREAPADECRGAVGADCD